MAQSHKSNKKRIKVLATGVLTKELGGNSTHGLATGIFDLVNSINELNSEIELILCATDYMHEKGKIKRTTILGVIKSKLLSHALKYPLRIIKYGVLTLKFRISYGMKLKSSFARLVFYDYVVAKEKPDFISAHGPSRGIIASHLIGFGPERVILRIHGISGMDKNIENHFNAKKQEQYATLQPFAAITHISSTDQYDWQKYYGKWKSHNEIILNGYDGDIFSIKKFRYIKNNRLFENLIHKSKINLLTVGSLQPRKGQLKVIRSIGKLNIRSKFKYICIGEGSKKYKEQMIQEAKTKEVDLKLLGYMQQEDIACILRKVDYMILPSTSEGFGKVYIESIACGTPIIIPKNLPLAKEPEILNNINAIFLNGNDTESIYDILVNLDKMINDREIISNSVSHLTWKIAAKAYNNLIYNIYKKNQIKF